MFSEGDGEEKIGENIDGGESMSISVCFTGVTAGSKASSGAGICKWKRCRLRRRVAATMFWGKSIKVGSSIGAVEGESTDCWVFPWSEYSL